MLRRVCCVSHALPYNGSHARRSGMEGAMLRNNKVRYLLAPGHSGPTSLHREAQLGLTEHGVLYLAAGRPTEEGVPRVPSQIRVPPSQVY